MPTIDQMYLHRILILSSALVVSLVGSASSFGLKSVTRAHAQERKAVIGHRKSALHADSTSGHDAARGTEGENKTLYGKYLDLLDAKPLETTSISAGVVSALGDILAQWVEARMAKTPFTMNWSRFLAFFISGTFFVGPYLHTWYGKVVFPSGKWVAEKWANASKNIQTLVSLLVDQTIGVAIFFPLYFYVYEYSEALTAWRAPNLAAAHTKCIEEIGSVYLMQYYIWPIVNWINFAYVPERLRVLAGNIVSVFWNAYLCTRVA